MKVNEINNIVNDGVERVTPLYLGRSVDKGENIVVDLDKYGSALVIGGCGTGKTWFVYNVVKNLIHFNESEDVDIRIHDPYFKWRSEELQEIKNKEHVTSIIDGNTLDFAIGIRELYEETLEREYNIEGKKQGEKLKPIYFIFDEMISTLETVEKELGKKKREEVEYKIAEVVKRGKAVGVRVIIVSQESVELIKKLRDVGCISWEYITKTGHEANWNEVCGGEGDKYPVNTRVGMGYFKRNEFKETEVELVNTVL